MNQKMQNLFQSASVCRGREQGLWGHRAVCVTYFKCGTWDRVLRNVVEMCHSRPRQCHTF